MVLQQQLISIHAPREGGDIMAVLAQYIRMQISIHAPREGGDLLSQSGPRNYPVFQSTPPARGATRECLHAGNALAFQSTPPARGATLLCYCNSLD